MPAPRDMLDWSTMESELLAALAGRPVTEMAAALGWLRPRASAIIAIDGGVHPLVAEGLVAIAVHRAPRLARALRRASTMDKFKASMADAVRRAGAS